MLMKTFCCAKFDMNSISDKQRLLVDVFKELDRHRKPIESILSLNMRLDLRPAELNLWRGGIR